MYTSTERVIRDGVLVAFEGEVMTDEEASSRGLVGAADVSPRQKRRKAEKPSDQAPDEPGGQAADEQEGA